jgi:hypothetical protein
MSLRDSLPGLLEGVHIQILRESGDLLNDIHAGASVPQRVKQHSVLQRRERIGVFDLFAIGRP